MLARTHQRRGDEAAAAQCLETAIRLPLPERIGAYFELAQRFVAAQRLAEAFGLVQDALLLQESNQTRWYKGRLHLLEGLIALGSGNPGACETALADAYRYDRSIDEMPLMFCWTRPVIRKAARHDRPYLRYLATRIRTVDAFLDYRAELTRLGPETYVVAIGAMDGVRFDALWEFIRSRRWKSVLVEPTAKMFSALQRNYDDCPFVCCAQLAISERNGPATMHRIRPDAVQAGLVGDWALGVSSLTLDSTLKFYSDLVETEEVEGCTFSDFARRYGIARIDVLQIDTEGHDHIILRGVPLDEFGVRVLHVELINVDPVHRLEVFDTVEQLGFRWHYDGNDITAVRPAASGHGDGPGARPTEPKPSPGIAVATAGPDASGMWMADYPRNCVPVGTIIRLPDLDFQPSILHPTRETGQAPGRAKFLEACTATFTCGFSDSVTATSFLPDQALCIERGGALCVVEESLWHSQLHLSTWFRSDNTTAWHWRVRRDWATARRIEGLIAHCYHRFHHQYFHWLADVMPRIWPLRRHSPYSQPDHWFVGPLNHPFKQPMLALYNIDPDMCGPDYDGVVTFESAICTGFRFSESLGTRPAYNSGLHHRGWSTAFINDIRKRALHRYASRDATRPRARLYVSRADAHHRHVRNERELRAVLGALGFEVLEPGRMTFEAQVQAFAHARCVVGVHGAGLTNIIWTPPGADILELLPGELDDAGYRFLSGLAGHRHHAILCRQFLHPHGPAYADIEVDMPVLSSALSDILAGTEV